MRRIIVSTIVMLAALIGSSAQAKPAYKKALADHYGPLLVRSLDDCGTCHASKEAGEPKFNTSLPNPHNAFGARLLSVVPELAKKGKPTDLATRLNAIAGEDSDRDGIANLAELLTGSRPGSAKSRPSAAELAKLPKFKTELARFRAAWPWKPFEAVRTPPVPKVKNAKWVRNPIDAFVAAEHEARGLKPRPEAPREVLLRRVHLDLIGLPPTREEIAAFDRECELELRNGGARPIVNGRVGERESGRRQTSAVFTPPTPPLPHSPIPKAVAPRAYERVVDRLLASPRYGERWGRHWMDVWRYSDWDGYGEEVRNSQRHIWRWRDWIIESLNEDKGYDRMVQEMLAGDELAPGDPKVLPATGFLVRNWYVFSRHEMLTKVIDGTGKAFLGMTLNCAQCHDHKFDPISQKEYFNFRAFFEPFDVRTDRVPGQPNVVKDGLPHVYDANAKAETLFLVGGDDRKPDKSQPASPGVPAAFGGSPLLIEPVKLPLTARAPHKQAFIIAEARTEVGERVAAARKALATVPVGPARDLAQLRLTAAERAQQSLEAVLAAEALEDLGAKSSDHPRFSEWNRAAVSAFDAQRQQGLAEAELARSEATVSLEQQRALSPQKPAEVKKAEEALAAADKKLAEAQAKLKSAPLLSYEPRVKVTYPETSTGRRLALARWITDRKNPLAARVAVNHIWLRHFGRALAPSVTDFGANGQRPTHPALLDWLAANFMSTGQSVNGSMKPQLGSRSVDALTHSPIDPKGWSMKRLHRLIVVSSTYRMDSTHDQGNGRLDAENRYLWRMNSRRMEAEVVRDSMLHASGQLDLTMGGPDLDQNLGLSSKRRSLYFRHSMEKQVEFLNTFDQVPPAECYERPETVMPQQALALANSALSVAQSRVLAGALWKQVEAQAPARATAEFVARAFQQTLGRPPSAVERVECERFLAEQSALLADPKKLNAFSTGAPNQVAPSAEAAHRARESLVHVLFNHHEFVTIR